MTNVLLLASVLLAVESGGNNGAVSPDGRCWGPLQETAIFVRDVNRIGGARFTYADAFDRQKAIEMLAIYMRHYATRARLRREPTMEDMARIHAGGPDGWRDPRTRLFWRKVAQELKTRRPAVAGRDAAGSGT